jgi:hypothetical protein
LRIWRGFVAREDDEWTIAAGENGEWTPISKCLFWDNDELLFDVGWVGVTGAGGAKTNDGQWHHIALAGPDPQAKSTELAIDQKPNNR